MITLRGVAHVHSTFSFDGTLEFHELAGFLRDRGVDFVLMSEHVETLDAGKIGEVISACEHCSTEAILFIPGIEIDDLNALFYDVKPVRPWSCLDGLARQLAAGGCFVAVSHPVKVVKDDIPAVTASLIEGVEVWNSRHDGKLAIDTSIVRFWQRLRKRIRRPVVPLCGIDFHKRSDFVPLMFEVSCERLATDEIMSAIRAGRYRIVRSGRQVPLDFQNGTMAPLYHMSSMLYRSVYRAVYGTHRMVRRIGLKPPSSLRRLLRRAF